MVISLQSLKTAKRKRLTTLQVKLYQKHINAVHFKSMHISMSWWSPKKVIQIVTIVLAFIGGFLGSYLYLSYKRPTPPVPVGKPEFDIPEAVDLPPTTYNFALLGYGGEGHDGGYLTDVIMVVHINPETKKAALLSIPRDLWVKIPVRSDLREDFKINSAYAIGASDTLYPLKETKFKGKDGGGELVKVVLQEVTGLTIDHYLAVNFTNFKGVIDALGGIRVDVPTTFDDHFYPVKGLENDTCGFSPEVITELHQKYSGFELEKQFTCRYERIHFDKGEVVMNGETALKFVRSRHSNTYGGDFSRSERQKAVLVGIQEKLLSFTAVKSARELYEEFSGLVETDVNLETFGGFIKLLGEPGGYTVGFSGLTTENVLVSGQSANGAYILNPKAGIGNWTEVKAYIKEELNNSTP